MGKFTNSSLKLGGHGESKSWVNFDDHTAILKRQLFPHKQTVNLNNLVNKNFPKLWHYLLVFSLTFQPKNFQYAHCCFMTGGLISLSPSKLHAWVVASIQNDFSTDLNCPVIHDKLSNVQRLPGSWVKFRLAYCMCPFDKHLKTPNKQ